LAVCDREPIQLPGAVQPHGALLAFDRTTLCVTHASANLESFIGVDPAACLGSDAATLLGAERAAQLPLLAQARRADSTAAGLYADLGRGRICLLPFVTANAIGLDVFREPPAEADEPLMSLAQHVIQALRLSRSSDGLCRIAVNDVRRITGYDRVMIYRFDADGNGDVIAEDAAPGVSGFLGLRYPASDIPQQARRLYMLQKLRVIVDVAAAPVTLLAASGSAPTDLDLSASWLRAVSPVHLRYLSNMGVAASAAVSLIVAGRLWGMLVCHHNSRHEISAYQRGQLDLVGQVMSVMLGSLMQSEIGAKRTQCKRALAGIAAGLANADPAIADAFAAAGKNLVNLIAADGVVVTVGERLIEIGCTPHAPAFRTLRAAFAAQPALDVTATDNLANSLRLPPQELDGFAGALHLPLPNCDGGSIVWLRRELNSTVTWAGDPHKRAADPETGRLEPRESFAAWSESVRGRSVPWTDADLECARDLRRIVDAALVQRSEGGSFLQYAQHHEQHDDSLPGLLSREALENHLNAVAELSPQPPTALAIVNMDRFRKVNDAHGRAAGDSLLAQIGQRLRAAVKAGDKVAHMGAAEFGVLSTMGLGIELAARLTAVFSQPFTIDGQIVPLQASVGVADNAPVAGHVRGLLPAAYLALRQAKMAGGDRVSLFAATASDGASRQMLIEQSLEAALRCDREQFRLALQPIVDAGSGAVLSWEVLLRWDHPLLGNIPPSEFIPIAESNGLIEDVGDLVLEAALRHLVEVPPSVELIGRDVSLSVNVSPSQLTRAGFAAEIGAMLDARGIEHSRLCLEITEAVLTNPQAVATLADARRLGILVAIDAFGIGQSSLATLQQLPADIVKLDRSFLPEQESATTGGRSFLTAVVALAHSAGLRVVVEGVENQVQLNAVVIAGADAIQGYLLGEPIPTEAAVAVACKSTEERTWQPRFAEAAMFAASASLAAESPGILERLRSSTRAAHASMERVPRLSRLLAPDVTARDYVQTLRLLHAFHASIEPDLARCLRGSSRAEALLDGKGLAALAADIAWFGALPLEPRPLQRPPNCVAAALGALYVIEGSNLGGRIIGKHVAKTLGVGPGTGGSFYCGLTAEDARRRWRLLQEVLRLEIDAPGTPWEPVTSAALATFDSLESWMRSDMAPLALMAS
jgi:diguanylate cyclase (GGDEF)-like protein